MAMQSYIPGYIRTRQTGWLKQAIQQALDRLSSCTLCPRLCRVDRTRDEKGFCSTGKKAVLASFSPHFGEEPPLVGHNGSGTLFFSYCSLKCVFCQNHDISISGAGQKADPEEIAAIMLHLQQAGYHNINLVTPTHVVPQILQALDSAIEHGLGIPLVYNCSGYENLDTLALLNGIIDIYMPDFKFWDNAAAGQYCHASDYRQTAKKAVLAMQAQVGDLVLDHHGIAVSGLLVRHLVMPGRLEETRRILQFLKNEVSSSTHVNLMSQYRPMGDAAKFPDLAGPLTAGEFKTAFQMGKDSGLKLIR
jgi:putative pyruvate formate lyase activating enzyme